MNTRHQGQQRLLAEINVVPYIDVMLVLLVIFMVTAPLLNQGVEVELPRASAKNINSKTNQALIVTVDNAGRYYLNVAEQPSEPIAMRELQTRIAAEIVIASQRGQTRPVFVKGDKQVPYGQVVQAMTTIQKAGVTSVGLLTEWDG